MLTATTTRHAPYHQWINGGQALAVLQLARTIHRDASEHGVTRPERQLQAWRHANLWRLGHARTLDAGELAAAVKILALPNRHTDQLANQWADQLANQWADAFTDRPVDPAAMTGAQAAALVGLGHALGVACRTHSIRPLLRLTDRSWRAVASMHDLRRPRPATLDALAAALALPARCATEWAARWPDAIGEA